MKRENNWFMGSLVHWFMNERLNDVETTSPPTRTKGYKKYNNTSDNKLTNEQPSEGYFSRFRHHVLGASS